MLLTPRRTGALLVASAVAANVAFLGLGTVFDYPRILQSPGADALRRFDADALRIGALFTLLALGAAALAPVAVGLARLAPRSRWRRPAVVVGIAAAAVQVVGLSRWPLLVPGLAATAADPQASPAAVDDAVARFALLGRVLGGLIGEAAGYALTAAFTVLVLAALREHWRLARVPTATALLSVPLILAGLLVPFGVEAADLANFVGYVLWSLWVIVLGVRLLVTGAPGRPSGIDHERAALPVA